MLAAAVVLLVACLAPAMYGAVPASATHAGPVGLIAFNRDGDIWTIRPDGSEPRRITVDGSSHDPAWSPDGTRLAYGTRSGSTGQLWTIQADGTNPHLVVSTANQFVEDPDWSPDGTRLLYSDSIRNMYLVNSADGGNRARFEDSPSCCGRWMPDGNHVLYAAAVSGGGSNLLYVADSDGTNRRQFLATPVNAYAADWSPDGTKIVYTPQDGPLGPQIATMDADGSNNTLLTNEGGQPHYFGNPYHIAWSPVWSPDSSHIAYDKTVSSDANAHHALFTMAADGSAVAQLTSGTQDDTSPSWQPQDLTPPSVTLSTPVDRATFERGQTVIADYSCTDAETGVASCAGTVATGSAIDSATIGKKAFRVTSSDSRGNTATVTHTYSVVATETGVVGPSGGTVSTNPDPTSPDPVGTSVSVPAGTAGGTVSITTSGDVTTPPPGGFSLKGYQVHIDAPVGTWDNPLVLGFTLDASQVGSADPESISLVRDGAPLSGCADGSTTAIAPDVAHPDGQPCLRSRQVLENGDVTFGVLTPHASDWNFATPK